MRIILASQSPRRKMLLEEMGLKFDIIPSDFEEHLDDSQDPEQVAIELAIGKANDVAINHPDAIVIGSDTIVWANGKQLGKPTNLKDATETLISLAGTEHKVISSLAVIWRSKNIIKTGADSVLVKFKPLDVDAIKKYVDSGDPLDKAGSYGVQSGAMPLIESVIGERSTIVGLPTKLLQQFLDEIKN